MKTAPTATKANVRKLQALVDSSPSPRSLPGDNVLSMVMIVYPSRMRGKRKTENEMPSGAQDRSIRGPWLIPPRMEPAHQQAVRAQSLEPPAGRNYHAHAKVQASLGTVMQGAQCCARTVNTANSPNIRSPALKLPLARQAARAITYQSRDNKRESGWLRNPLCRAVEGRGMGVDEAECWEVQGHLVVTITTPSPPRFFSPEAPLLSPLPKQHQPPKSHMVYVHSQYPIHCPFQQPGQFYTWPRPEKTYTRRLWGGEGQGGKFKRREARRHDMHGFLQLVRVHNPMLRDRRLFGWDGIFIRISGRH